MDHAPAEGGAAAPAPSVGTSSPRSESSSPLSPSSSTSSDSEVSDDEDDDDENGPGTDSDARRWRLRQTLRSLPLHDADPTADPESPVPKRRRLQHEPTPQQEPSRRPTDPITAVLTSVELFPTITTFMSGWPKPIADFLTAHRKRRIPNDRTVLTAIVKIAEDDEHELLATFLRRCYADQPRAAVRRRMAIEIAITKGKRRMLELLLAVRPIKPHKRVSLCALAFNCSDGDPQILDLLHRRLELTAADVTAALEKLMNESGVRYHGDEFPTLVFVDLPLARWIHENAAAPIPRRIVDNAVRRGLREAVIFLLSHGHKFTVSSLKYALKNFDYDLFERLLRYADPVSTRRLMFEAAEHGLLDLVTALDGCDRAIDCDESVMDVAASRGHLHIVRYLHEHRREGCTISAMDSAAANGHVDVVKFLNADRHEGCSPEAMTEAAANGHLQIVEFLFPNRNSDGDLRQALRGAVRNGHLAVVKFLWDRCRVEWTAHRLIEVVRANNLEVLKFVIERTSHLLQWPATAMNMAACAGNLAAVQALHEIGTLHCTTDAMDGAAARDHLDVVKFLHFNRSEGCTTAAMDETTSVEIARFLHENRSEGCTVLAWQNAINNDACADKLDFLSLHYSHRCPGSFLSRLLSQGRFSVWERVKEKYQSDGAAQAAEIAFWGRRPSVLRYLVDHGHGDQVRRAFDLGAHTVSVRWLAVVHKIDPGVCSLAAIQQAMMRVNGRHDEFTIGFGKAVNFTRVCFLLSISTPEIRSNAIKFATVEGLTEIALALTKWTPKTSDFEGIIDPKLQLEGIPDRYFGLPSHRNWVEYAIAERDFPVIKCLWDYSQSSSDDAVSFTRVQKEAVKRGDQGVLQFLLETIAMPCDGQLVDRAIRHKHYPLAEWLLAKNYPDAARTFKYGSVRVGAGVDDVGVIDWILETEGLQPHVDLEELVVGLVSDGHTKLLRHLHKLRPEAFATSRELYAIAGCMGHVATAECLHELGYSGGEATALKMSATLMQTIPTLADAENASNTVRSAVVAEFLRQHRTPGHTPHPLFTASRHFLLGESATGAPASP